MFPGALSMRAMSCSGKNRHRSVAILPVHTETPALSCHCGIMLSHHIVIFSPFLRNIYLHVQISNESAIDFYRKFGFEIIETKKNYYKRIEPADAHVLQKNLKVPSGQNAETQKTDN